MSQGSEKQSISIMGDKPNNPSGSNSNNASSLKGSAAHKRPGRLKGEVTLTLHTAYAQKLFLGFQSDKRANNLLQFGGRMTELWDAAERDNPYADWYLLKVYDALIQLQQQLREAIENYQAQLNQANHVTNLTITIFESQQPVVELLWFRTQYGYMAASLVAHFDRLMRIVLTANRVGVRLDQSEKAIRQFWLEQLLALFRLPFKWKSLALTRADFKAQNEQAKTAQEKMGQLPEAILSCKLRSPYAPSIKPVLSKEREPPQGNTS